MSAPAARLARSIRSHFRSLIIGGGSSIQERTPSPARKAHRSLRRACAAIVESIEQRLMLSVSMPNNHGDTGSITISDMPDNAYYVSFTVNYLVWGDTDPRYKDFVNEPVDYEGDCSLAGAGGGDFTVTAGDFNSSASFDHPLDEGFYYGYDPGQGSAVP